LGVLIKDGGLLFNPNCYIIFWGEQTRTNVKGFFMELNSKVLAALNAQIGMEYEASLGYDAIGCCFTAEDLPQLAKFFFKQSTEERDHAHKFIKFVLDRGGQVQIPAIPAPTFIFASPLEAAKAAEASERKVSSSIHKLYDLSLAERDHATTIMLQWFITEQVEEEAKIKQMVKFVQRGKESGMMTVEDYLADAGSEGK
jgi:ferritin